MGGTVDLERVLKDAHLPALMAALVPLASAQAVIKIGEVNSYKVQPAFLEPYKKGMELAVDQVQLIHPEANRPAEAAALPGGGLHFGKDGLALPRRLRRRSRGGIGGDVRVPPEV